jgi:hypothetical protein
VRRVAAPDNPFLDTADSDNGGANSNRNTQACTRSIQCQPDGPASRNLAGQPCTGLMPNIVEEGLRLDKRTTNRRRILANERLDQASARPQDTPSLASMLWGLGSGWERTTKA